MDELKKISAEVFNLLKEINVKSFLDEWNSIQNIQVKQKFSVAVVGEFSRGKSTLLNRLLGQDILPVGNLPTTSFITHIRYAPELAISKISPDGRCQKLSPQEMQDLTIANASSALEDHLDVEIPNTWLDINKVEFLDTPGAGDLETNRSEITQRAIMECDATLVVISATMPLSLTEKAFVEEHIFQRKIPRVAFVLTRLDQIKENERASVIRFILQKIQAWNPNIELWSSHAEPILVANSAISVVGPEQILQAIAKWTLDKEHKELRTQQILEHTYCLIKKASYYLLRQKAVLMSEKDSNEINAQREAKECKTQLALDWKDITIAIEQKELEVEHWLEHELQTIGNDLISELQSDLKKAENLQDWAQKEFPRLLKKSVEQMIRTAEKHLETSIQDDTQWLEYEMRKKFSQTIFSDKPRNILQSENQPISSIQFESESLSIEHIGIGVVTGIVTSLSFPILGTVLFPTTIVGGAIAGLKLLQKQKEQKQKIELELSKIVENMITKMLEKSKTRLREYYQNIVKKVTNSATEYLDIAEHAVAIKYTYDERHLILVQQQEREAKNLLKMIQGQMKI